MNSAHGTIIEIFKFKIYLSKLSCFDLSCYFMLFHVIPLISSDSLRSQLSFDVS